MADTVIGSLIYKITGDSAALDSSLDMSRQKIDRTGDSLIRLGQRARTIATVVFSGVFIKSLLESSSRVEELGNKFDTVFSGIERESDAWARKYANDTSRGVTATKEFLAAQQDIRTGYGDSTEKAALFSRAVVGVTNDLASFSNVPVGEAMQAINSGLSQQFEALRRLGIGLNVQIINQGAYAKTIGKTWDEMSNLERQEAILSGIMSQSQNATHQSIQTWQDYDYTIGDAARTSDSFANSSQGLAQSIDDMKAELGEALMPIATDIIQLALEGVKWFNGWDDSMQRLTVSALAFGAAMISIGGPLGTIVGVLAALLIAVGDNRNSLDDLKSSTDSLKRANNEYSAATRELSDNIDNLTSQERLLLEVRREQARLNVQKSLNEAMTAYSDASDELGKFSDSLEYSKGAYNAYVLAIENGYDSAAAKLSEYESRLNELTNEEKGAYNALVDVVTEGVSGVLMWTKKIPEDEFIQKIKELAAEEYKNLTGLQQHEAKHEAARADLIMSAAEALNLGVISANAMKLIYPDLADEIFATAEALKKEGASLEEDKKAIESSIAVGDEWRARREEQLAGILDDLGEYQKAADIRKGILEEERKAELDALAVSAGIMKEEEQLTQEKLKSALESNEEFAAEYYALNQYYSSEIAAVRKDASDKIEAEMDRQRKAEQELADERNRECG